MLKVSEGLPEFKQSICDNFVYELERGELAFPLDPKSSDAGAATLLFGGALLTLTAVVAGAFFLVLV